MPWYFAVPPFLPQALQDWLLDHGAEFWAGAFALGVYHGARFFEESHRPAKVDGIAKANSAIDDDVHVDALGDGTRGLAQLGCSQQRLGHRALVAESASAQVDRIEAHTHGKGSRKGVER